MTTDWVVTPFSHLKQTWFYKHKVMEKKSCSVNREPPVKEVFEHVWNELKGEKTKKPKLDVPPPPDFGVDLCIRKEDMNKYKVGGSSPLASEDHLKNLGFVDGVNTQMCVRNKNVLFSPKALQMLGRSWFKEGLTEEDQRASMYMAKKEEKKEDDADRFIAKEMLQQFVKQAKARRRIPRQKGKKVDEKQIRSTSAPCRGKKKQAKFRRLNEIMSSNE